MHDCRQSASFDKNHIIFITLRAVVNMRAAMFLSHFCSRTEMEISFCLQRLIPRCVVNESALAKRKYGNSPRGEGLFNAFHSRQHSLLSLVCEHVLCVYCVTLTEAASVSISRNGAHLQLAQIILLKSVIVRRQLLASPKICTLVCFCISTSFLPF